MDGWPALSIHGDKSKAERDWVLSEFKAGKSPIMTTTARGLDVKYVLNYDFPGSLEDYVHMIGQTGRVGAKGTSYTFFTATNARFPKELIAILQEVGQKVNLDLVAMGWGAPPTPSGNETITEMVPVFSSCRLVEMVPQNSKFIEIVLVALHNSMKYTKLQKWLCYVIRFMMFQDILMEVIVLWLCKFIYVPAIGI